MKDWPHLPTDAELERADSLLNQADALLSRHRSAPPEAVPGAMPTTGQVTDESSREALPPYGASLADEDLPILTEIVDELDLPPEWTEHAARPLPPLSATASVTASVTAAFNASPLAGPTSSTSTSTPAAMTAEDHVAYQIAERLIDLDTQIARSVTEWMDKEFPQFLQRELDRLSEHLQTEMQAHLRATLLPALSAHISEQLELTPGTATPLSR